MRGRLEPISWKPSEDYLFTSRHGDVRTGMDSSRDAAHIWPEGSSVLNGSLSQWQFREMFHRRVFDLNMKVGQWPHYLSVKKNFKDLCRQLASICL